MIGYPKGRHPGRALRALGLTTLICTAPVLHGTQISAPFGAAQAQVVLGPAQAELKRVTVALDSAVKSGDGTRIVKALGEAQDAINNASKLPTSKLDPLIKSARQAYARAALALVGQLTASCEKAGHRDDGQAASKILAGAERDVGEFVNRAAASALRTRLTGCLPVQKYVGKYYFKSKLPSSSQNYVADVTWTLWQELPGGMRSYRASGTITATGTADRCSGTLKAGIDTELGVLTVNEITGAGTSVPNTYMFAFGTRNLIKMTCPNGGTLDVALDGGDTCEPKSYVDINRLVGSCKDALIDARWLFEAVTDTP